jgi:hypothetical protein
MSRHFTLFHMALADKGVAEERLAARGGLTQHRSFVDHQTDRLDAIAQTGAARWTSPRPPPSRIAISRWNPTAASPSGPRASSHPAAVEQGLPVEIPERFFGLV